MPLKNGADATTQGKPAIPHVIAPSSLIRPRDPCGEAFILRDPSGKQNDKVPFAAARGLLAILSWRRPFDSNGEEIFARHYLDCIEGMAEDGFKNRHLRIPYEDGTPCNVIWSCHIDTCHHDEGYQRLSICKDDNDLAYVRTRRGEGNCLGADDGTGVWLMLEMIAAKRPGRYIFHRGEERGCLGSKWILAHAPELLNDATAAIALDRKDFNNIITHQGGERGCSEAFAASIAAQIEGYKADPTGLFTDTRQYFRKIPECTNLSVGYQSQHGPLERQYLDFAVSLRSALLAFDTRQLVIERDPSKYEYQSRGGYHGNTTWHESQNRSGTTTHYRVTNGPDEEGYDSENINPNHKIHQPTLANKEFYVWSKSQGANILRCTSVFIIGKGFMDYDRTNPAHVLARELEKKAVKAPANTITESPSVTVTKPTPDDSISPDNELFDLQLEIDMERSLGELCFTYPTAASKLLEAAGLSADDMLQMVYGDYLDEADADASEDADEIDATSTTQDDGEAPRLVTVIGGNGESLRVTVEQACKILEDRRLKPTTPAAAAANGLVSAPNAAEISEDDIASGEAMARAFREHLN